MIIIGLGNPRKRRKAVLNASVDISDLVTLENIAIKRRIKFSTAVQEVIKLGLEKYSEKEFEDDLKEAKRMEIETSRILHARHLEGSK